MQDGGIGGRGVVQLGAHTTAGNGHHVMRLHGDRCDTDVLCLIIGWQGKHFRVSKKVCRGGHRLLIYTEDTMGLVSNVHPIFGNIFQGATNQKSRV